MQAIKTTHHGPTSRGGDRVVAVSGNGGKRTTVEWDPALDVYDNHKAAAERHAERMGWSGFGRLVGGSLPGGGYAFVLVSGEG